MYSRFTPVLLVLLIACSCSRFKVYTAEAKKNSCQVTQDDYAVMNAVVIDIRNSPDTRKYFRDAPIFVSDTAIEAELRARGPSEWAAGSNSKELPKETTLEEFARRSATACPWSAGHEDRLNYTIFTPAEEERIFKRGDGWLVFYKEYPRARGVLDFSLPGYSPKKDEAIVFLQNDTGGIDAAHRLYFLRKQEGEWRVVNWLDH